MRLTKNFTLGELTKSKTAVRRRIGNTPDPGAVEALRQLAKNVLQPARDYLGVPLRVHSGFRSWRLNRVVGGAWRSDHLRGLAADVETVPDDSASMVVLGAYIESTLDFKQLIWEFGGSWIHVSYEVGANRKEVLEAYRSWGRTRYRPFTFLNFSA